MSTHYRWTVDCKAPRAHSYDLPVGTNSHIHHKDDSDEAYSLRYRRSVGYRAVHLPAPGPGGTQRRGRGLQRRRRRGRGEGHQGCRRTGDRGSGRRRRPVPDRQGGRGRPRRVRADRDPGDQRRRVPPGAVRADQRGVLGADRQRQPDRHLPLRAGGDRGHDRRGLGPGGDDLLVERTARRPRDDPLRGLQGRGDRVRQGARPRVRQARRHRQQHRSLGRGNADGGAAAGGRRGAVPRGDGPRGARRPHGHRRRHRRRLPLPGLRGGLLCHGPDRERQRRIVRRMVTTCLLRSWVKVTDIRQVFGRERTRTIAGAVVVAALVAVVIDQSWSGLPVTGSAILGFLITGVALGSIYGVAAQGLVVTYATSGVFNFAQGAIGMFLAFVYWQLRVEIGLPTIVGILLTVLIAAPLVGVLIERLIMRFLTDSPIVAQLVVTIGLMLGLMGLAGSIWNPNSSTQRVIPTFFGVSGFNLGSTFLPYYRVVTIATGIAVGLLLRFLLYHTRLGVTMRAVVDNRDLTVLNGARPASATMTAWALGSSMAALAGIFLAEELSALDPSTLTLFIVDAFAAAIIARLRSLPMAYVGGLIIGLSLSFQENFLNWSGRWTSAPQAIPAAILFIAVIFIKDARIKGRSKPRQTAERIPSNRHALLGFALLIVIALICAAPLNRENLREVILIVLTAFVLLSLVPLTGWANQISLAQITLVGCGAFAMVEWGGGGVLGLVVAAAFAVPIGMIMGGPAARR